MFVEWFFGSGGRQGLPRHAKKSINVAYRVL